MAERRGAKIKYIFETRFHADFESHLIDLAKKTDAPIIYVPTSMKNGFEAIKESAALELTKYVCPSTML